MVLMILIVRRSKKKDYSAFQLPRPLQAEEAGPGWMTVCMILMMMRRRKRRS